ncbi:MAG: hypothetical protein P4L28_10815 [Paludibacteraceae bacterium]|nr:hypothetical protein [Paludibacteraceae bacterium]
MYDTVNSWIDRAIAGDNPLAIASYLSDVSETNSQKYGYSVTGKANNYIVRASEAGISLKGSLSKFFLNDNIQTLTRSATVQAIEKLSDTLHIPVKEAKIYRIDISTVFNTKYPPANYYKYLGNKPYFERLLATNNTLYYSTQKRQLIFYDKQLEAKSTGTNVPDVYTNESLLRYELRFTKRLCEQLKQNEITGATLSDEHFYLKLIKLWEAEYFSINKLNGFGKMDVSKIKTRTDAKDAMLTELLQGKDINYINEFISDLKAKNINSDPKYYTRLKNDLTALFKASSTEQNELITELDKEVNTVLQYCR